MDKQKEVERSIIKKYRKEIWAKFIHAIKEYQLVEEKDSIMVCISGGKDSFLMAKCFQELKKHGQMNFSLRFVVMDPGYEKSHLKQIKDNANLLGIPIEIFSSDIFAVVAKCAEKSPCYLCARMRRGYLYNYAKEIGCNKIALGHHFDDVIETSLLSMFYSAEIKTMLPKLPSDHFEGLELIRPLYQIREASILSWQKYNHLEFINCACHLTKEEKGKRKEIKDFIAYMREKNKDIDYSIFKSMENVNLDCVLGYHKGEEKHYFLDEYEKKERNRS